MIPYNLFTEKVAIYLEDLFKGLFYSYNEKACPNILQDIQYILLIFENAKYSPNTFLNFIELNLSRKKINNLYLDIIKNKRISENEHLKKRMIQFLTQKKGLNDIESLVYVLKNIEITKNHSFIDEIISSLDNFIIIEDDFFEEQINNKFRLYNDICKLFNKNKLRNNYNYFKRCKETLNNIFIKIENFEFTYQEIIQINLQIDQDYFKEKLRILINNDDISNIYYHIKNFIKRFDKIYNELLNAYNFYKIFFSNSKKSFIENYIENNIIKLKEKININLLNEIEGSVNINSKIKKALKYGKLINSRFFIALFNDCKKKSKENETQLFDDCIKHFCELELLNNWNEDIDIEQIPNYKIISEEIASIIKENKKDKKKCEEIIHEELNIIKYIYNITDNKQQIINMDLPIKNSKSVEIKLKNNIIEENGKEDLKSLNKSIEENLIYLPFLETLKKVLYSIKSLIEIFQVVQTDTYIIIKNMVELLDSKGIKITLKNIKDYINLLASNKNIEIDIASFDKKDKLSILVDILALLYNKEDEIKFAFIKKSEEIKALLEFVGETENSKIQIKDILDFINVSDFFDNIISLSIENDNKLIEELKISFQASPSFGNTVNNYLNNFKEIKNVYEEFLNKPEVSRKKIEQILKHSNIELFFNNNSLSIEIKGSYTDFLNNDKTFNNKDLQELHDRALLFSNKPFDNMSIYVVKDFKEKQEQSKIFVEIVENINILIKYLNDLYIKGYPFSIEVKITIDNYKAFDHRKNDIKKIIENYRNITVCLEEAQTEAYKEKPLIRLIFGHQFYNIYRYLNNRNNENNIIPLLNKISDNKIKKIQN